MPTFSRHLPGEFRMRGSFKRKGDEPGLGCVNVMPFGGHENGGSYCNLEKQVKRWGDRSGSVTYDCLKQSFHELKQ